MNAFITGSHAYGTPRDDSDVDLVVRVDNETRKKLIKLLIAGSDDADESYDSGVLQFKVDSLNLILCVTDAQYEAWSKGTAGLIAMAPVTRDQAVSVLKPLLEIAKARDGGEVVATAEPLSLSSFMGGHS